MERDRDDAGQYVDEIGLDEVIHSFQVAEIPVLTATEVAEALDCARPTAYNKLETLVEKGNLHKKKVGARAVVYIRLEELDHPG